MTSSRFIQFKAAFLLVVFTLNIMVGFACSMGVDMGFNASHHRGDAARASVHIHKDGKRHEHKPGTVKKHNSADKETASNKGDCCKEKVVQLQTSDKVLNAVQATLQAPVFNLSSFLKRSFINTVKGVMQKYIACQFHPPPCDIRIQIRSFQI
ncbi:MAG: hypothetical protein M0Q26_11395 [Chitinophagaceae bacterium]|nr:hypothetical protein [Chitinophagaceae bacterium]MDP1764280.1 hypothetical protein [Sediminibacterium sp.]MDP1810439.1 hypothetical protein [Sediminibacterium sp.]MDP3129072.1 hypothetical protein [Sediminibacterium sp.]MDP3665110.1 hypothetical protein [Sediminibacterium sp.]